MFGHVVGEPFARRDPVRLALEHSQVLDLVDTGIDNLHSGATGSDDRHPFTSEVQRRIPQRRVNAGARERVPARQIRPARPVEVAGSGDNDTGVADVAIAVAVNRVDLPLLAVFVPPQSLDFGAEPGVLAQPVLVGQRHQVVLIFTALRVVARPVRVHLARQRVVRRRRIHADARIGRGQPRAADFVVAFEDLVGDARIGGGERDDDAGESGANDGHRQCFRNRRRSRQRRLRKLEAALLEQQRNELVIDIGAERQREQRARTVRGRRRPRASAGCVQCASMTAVDQSPPRCPDR